MIEELRGLGLDIELSKLHDSDPNNFNLDQLGSWFGYAPKNTKRIIPVVSTRNQGSLNSCVTQAISGQKEIAEGVELSAGYLGASLVSKGLMNIGGTSIKAGMQETIDSGIAEESLCPTSNTTFGAFSNPAQLTQANKDNAGSHKNKSYWQTNSLDAVLQQLDGDNPGECVGVTGAYWYPEYNNVTTQPLVLPVAPAVAGHCFKIIGYDLNYKGMKVVILHNSFGADWGDHGMFYVKFEDFNKIIQFSSYFVLDIAHDIASWLSLNAHRAIIDTHSPARNGGQPVFLIEGNYKRWIPDEAMMDILGILPKDLLHDADNMLAGVLEGIQMGIADVPPVVLDDYKRKIELLNNPRTIAQLHMKFPTIF